MIKISAIVCVDENGGIGYNDGLLYKNPYDMMFFMGHTVGKIVVGGRKTMEGIKRLPNREMVCLTRDSSVIADLPRYAAVTTVEKFDDVVELAAYLETDVVIIGGEQIYAQLADKVDDLYLTVLKLPDEMLCVADAFFPASCYNHLNIREVVFENNEMTIYHCFRK